VLDARIVVRLQAGHLAALRSAARQEDRTTAAIVRRLIRERVDAATSDARAERWRRRSAISRSGKSEERR